MTSLPAHDSARVKAFREEVRAWLAQHWSEEHRAAYLERPFKERGWDPGFSRLLAKQGWIGLGWPKQYGGQGRSAPEQITFVEEMTRALAPCAAHSTGESIVAHALFAHGSLEQKE